MITVAWMLSVRVPRLLLGLCAPLLAVTNVTVTQTIYTSDNSLANGSATISLTGPCTDRSDRRVTREVPVTVSIVNGAFSRSLQATSKCMENPGPQYKVVFSFTNDAVTTRIRYWHVYADGTVEETAEQRSRWVSVASPLNITDSGISCSTCLSSAATYPDPSWLPSLSASKISGGTLSAGRMPALTGEVTTSAGSVATTIAAGAVSTAKVADNAVTNAKLATMADQRLKGNVSGGTAAPSDLTAAQVAAMLPAFVGDSGSGGTKGLVPAPASGDATKFLRADGTWTLIAPGLIDILSLSELSDVTAKTGTGTTVVMSASPTITTPTIASFANANHTHQNAAGGGTLDGAAIASGTIDVARISQAAVTQHQAALTIAASQLTGASVGATANTIPVRDSESRGYFGYLSVAASASQFSALVTARDSTGQQRNAFEWGHPNTSGYGNTIGFESASGVPFMCFYCSAGTNINTYKTWGNKGAVVSATDGHLAFGRVVNASADNQSLRVDGKFTDAGEFLVYNNIHSYNATGQKGFVATSGATQLSIAATDAGGGYGIIGTTTAHPLLLRVANSNKLTVDTGILTTGVYGHVFGSGFGANQDVTIDVGANRTGSGITFVDLISDTTYTDYGLRLIRYGTGPNTTSSLIHRGTGALVMSVYDAGVFVVEVGGAERMSISSTSTILRHLGGSGTAHVCADDNGVLSRCP